MSLLKKIVPDATLLLLFCIFVFSSAQGIFRNPIHIYDPTDGCADPYIYLHTDNFYYWARCGPNRTIVLLKSQDLTNFDSEVLQRTIFESPDGTPIIETEIHFIGHKWYIYFAMQFQGDVSKTENFVLESAEAFGPYNVPIRLGTGDMPPYSIHGTVLQHNNGQLYFLWAGRQNVSSQNETIFGLYIAQMASPTKLVGQYVLLRKPTSHWEIGGILESPQIIPMPAGSSRICLAYSEYINSNAGVLCIEDWKHPLVAENWILLKDESSFSSNEIENVFLSQAGKVSFTTSPDRTESWVVYKAFDELGKLSIRIERHGWSDGYPILPRPTGLQWDLSKPSNRTFEIPSKP